MGSGNAVFVTILVLVGVVVVWKELEDQRRKSRAYDERWKAYNNVMDHFDALWKVHSLATIHPALAKVLRQLALEHQALTTLDPMYQRERTRRASTQIRDCLLRIAEEM